MSKLTYEKATSKLAIGDRESWILNSIHRLDLLDLFRVKYCFESFFLINSAKAFIPKQASYKLERQEKESHEDKLRLPFKDEKTSSLIYFK